LRDKTIERILAIARGQAPALEEAVTADSEDGDSEANEPVASDADATVAQEDDAV
jgi:hypothetical protein